MGSHFAIQRLWRYASGTEEPGRWKRHWNLSVGGCFVSQPVFCVFLASISWTWLNRKVAPWCSNHGVSPDLMNTCQCLKHLLQTYANMLYAHRPFKPGKSVRFPGYDWTKSSLPFTLTVETIHLGFPATDSKFFGSRAFLRFNERRQKRKQSNTVPKQIKWKPCDPKQTCYVDCMSWTNSKKTSRLKVSWQKHNLTKSFGQCWAQSGPNEKICWMLKTIPETICCSTGFFVYVFGAVL